MFETKQYERLQAEDDESQDLHNPTSLTPSKSRRSLVLTLIGTLAAGITLGILTTLAFHAIFDHSLPYNPIVVEYSHDSDQVYGCGNSTTEAKALGCTFNPLSMAWLRDECYDKEITQAFLDAGDWRYFADEDGTREIDIEEVAMSADTGAKNWLSKQWHMTHCAFMWQKMHRAMLSRERRLEPSLLVYGHTTHCGRVITHDLPRDKLLTIITPQFEEC